METDLIESDDVVGAPVDESGDHDLAVIEATREGLLQQCLFGAIPETVGEPAPTTVLMTRRNLDPRTQLQLSLEKLRERLSGRSTAMELGKTQTEPDG